MNHVEKTGGSSTPKKPAKKAMPKGAAVSAAKKVTGAPKATTTKKTVSSPKKTLSSVAKEAAATSKAGMAKRKKVGVVTMTKVKGNRTTSAKLKKSRIDRLYVAPGKASDNTVAKVRKSARQIKESSRGMKATEMLMTKPKRSTSRGTAPKKVKRAKK